MTGRMFVRFSSLILILGLAVSLALVPQLFHTGPVAAQTTATSTPVGTSTGTPGGTGTGTNGGVATIFVCGTVSSYTAATSGAAGAVTIGGFTFPIVVNTTVTGGNLVTTGAILCLMASLSTSGQIVAASVSTFTGTTPTVNLCGMVTAFTASTASAAGTITIAGVTFPIAVGTTFTGPSLVTNGMYCVQGTLNATGQLASATFTSTPLAATPYQGGGVRVGRMIAS